MLSINDNLALTEDDLSNVSGGNNNTQIVRIACCKCQKPFWVNLNKTTIMCPYCREPNHLSG